MKLLAKSHGEKTIAEHTRDVLVAFDALFGQVDAPSRLAECWLQFFLPHFEVDEIRRFFACTRLAAALHDIGKANSGFQKAVRGEHDAQVIRHEHLSGLILMESGWVEVLSQMAHVDFEIVLCAVIGHHLQSGREELAQQRNPNRNVIRVFDAGVIEVSSVAQEHLPGFQTPVSRGTEQVWGFGVGDVRIEPLRKQLCDLLRRFKRQLANDDRLNRLVIAVRAALIVADSAGSALTREGKPLSEWICESFPRSPSEHDPSCSGLLDPEYVRNHVIERRIAQLGKRWRGWDDFQRAADSLDNRALLIASCGSGKTLAAWRWIESRLIEHPAARVVFLYPTRATATEGFRDYVSWAPEDDGALLTGTGAYELDGMFENPDERAVKDFTTEDRLFAIGFWQRRVFSATVDQFLGFMQHAYRSMCLLPVLVDSVIVIDEVHSFDKSLFSALKVFLRFSMSTQQPPVLCMTASLPEERKRELVEECGLELFPASHEPFQQLNVRAEMARYAVTKLSDACAAETIAQAYRAAKRVLWVVNTVKRCQQLARRFDALCYHSRFKLDDRKERHKELIVAFQRTGRPVLAITTQVCEMSLDLDADVMITEAAPITSLIQRMGRCNRHANSGDGKLGNVYLYKPTDWSPYREDDVRGVADFLTEIDGQNVSQQRLQELLEKYGPAEPEVDRYSAFVESGPWASSREENLRDIDEFTVPGILDCDAWQFANLRNQGKPTDGLLLPVPGYLMRRDRCGAIERPARIPKYLALVPSDWYDRKFGLTEHEE